MDFIYYIYIYYKLVFLQLVSRRVSTRTHFNTVFRCATIRPVFYQCNLQLRQETTEQLQVKDLA